RAFSRWTVAQGVPVANLSGVKPPRVPERIQPRVRPEEFNALEASILHRMIDATGRYGRISIVRDLALICLLADTGLRAAEICNMTLEAVDFATGSIVVYRGKGNKARAMSIRDPADPSGGTTLRMLAERIEARKDLRDAQMHRYLWVSMRGRPLSRETLR